LSSSGPTFHHVAVIVSDLDKAAHLYGNILGLELDERPHLNFGGLFYKLGNGQQLHLMRLENPDAESLIPEHGGRYRHFALRFADLNPIKTKLTEMGVHFTASKSGRKAIFLYDDDGNAIELVQQSITQAD